MNGRKLLIDSNIIIYLSQKLLMLDTFVRADDELFISDITYMETLGFPFANDKDKNYMRLLLNQFKRIALTDAIVEKTVLLKQSRKIKLPDAVIAVTAQVFDLELITRNIKDFERMNIAVTNPMD